MLITELSNWRIKLWLLTLFHCRLMLVSFCPVRMKLFVFRGAAKQTQPVGFTVPPPNQSLWNYGSSSSTFINIGPCLSACLEAVFLPVAAVRFTPLLRTLSRPEKRMNVY